MSNTSEYPAGYFLTLGADGAYHGINHCFGGEAPVTIAAAEIEAAIATEEASFLAQGHDAAWAHEAAMTGPHGALHADAWRSDVLRAAGPHLGW